MCDCVRVTLRYRCRHKYRKVIRCWAYNFKEYHSCLGTCLPMCDPARVSKRKDKFCAACRDYFSRYGDNADYVIEKFVAYKQNNGLSREAIDPKTVSRSSYLTTEERRQLRAGGNQPFHPKSPMRATQAPALPPLTHLQLPPPAHHSQHRHRRPTPFEPNLQPSSGSDCSFDLAAEGILATDYALSPPGPEYPVREHGTGLPIDLSDLVDPEPDHDHGVPRGRPLSCSPKQPVAIRRKPLVNVKSACSLVKKIDEMAITTQIAGYPNPESPNYPRVPKLQRAPKKPSWRRDTPRPYETQFSDEESASSQQAADAFNLSLKSAPLHPARYYLPYKPSADFPPSQHSAVTSAPACPRHGNDYFDGCLNCRKGFFRERGLPSPTDEFVYQPALSSAPERPVTVSPKRRFTCAIQSACYCRSDSKGNHTGPKCPPCRERESLKQQLGMEWI
ncbi:hypothetical protein F5B20DRAFT_541082 [Whalleya microplaca]|nr:hypothetical protein F5B20DRAFT_541082 [Whalleya microplaca]